jgi:hypothetical protein
VSPITTVIFAKNTSSAWPLRKGQVVAAASPPTCCGARVAR